MKNAPGRLGVLVERFFDVFSTPRKACSGCNFGALVLRNFEACMYPTFLKEIAALRVGNETHIVPRGQAEHSRE